MSARTFRVKELARVAGVTVRTLHHYDDIGLLVPRERSAAGYRLYDDDDLLRLQQILIGRELGLSLEDIRRMLDDPAFDRRAALLRQREQLEQRLHSAEAMLRSIDEALRVLEDAERGPDTEQKRGAEMDMSKLFDGFDPAKYEAEAEQRWGNTDAYKESAKRAKRYTEDDWKRMKAEADDVMRALASAWQAGARADSDEVMDLADRHREHISRWFYPCSKEMHAGLADMFLVDERFAVNIDKYGAGLTPFFSAAIKANAARQ